MDKRLTQCKLLDPNALFEGFKSKLWENSFYLLTGMAIQGNRQQVHPSALSLKP